MRSSECASVFPPAKHAEPGRAPPSRPRAASAPRRLPAAVAAAALASPGAAAAMDFSAAPGPSGRVVIYATGGITTGDAGRLRFALYEAGDKPAHLVISSGGGLAAEGVKLAQMVAAERIPVTAGDLCASACFLVLAASPDRYAGPASRVGVHRAYHRTGVESTRSLDTSVDLARYAASFGVPGPILGRMVTTPGSGTSIAWLSQDELRSMNVKFAQPAPVAQQPAAPAAAAQPPPVAAGTNTAEAGKADRANYRRWLAGLSDSGRQGASFWARQRLLPQPGNCLRGGDNAFSLACFEAQRWWARVDERSRDPEYRRGWDGY